MKKLESLENFNKSELSETHQSKILGGVGPTGGGTRETVATSTGCQGYASDNVSNDDVWTYYGTYEIDPNTNTN